MTNEVYELAKELFIRNWQPNTGRTVQHTVTLCVEAAEAFCEVKPKAKKKTPPKSEAA